jgi:hypothetical protein
MTRRPRLRSGRAGTSLRPEAVRLGQVTAAEFDHVVRPDANDTSLLIALKAPEIIHTMVVLMNQAFMSSHRLLSNNRGIRLQGDRVSWVRNVVCRCSGQR